MDRVAKSQKQIIVLHETSGRPYYKALERVCENEGISIRFLESSVLRLTMAHLVKRTFSIDYFMQIFRNIWFRLLTPFVKDKIVVYAMAPFDFRMLWYRALCKKNTVIYHTSWPYWQGDDVPRHSFLIEKWVRASWEKFFDDGCDLSIGVLDEVCRSLTDKMKPRNPVVSIPHVVDFKNKSQKTKENEKLRVLFVGKLIPEKGMDFLVKLSRHCQEHGWALTVVGDGAEVSKVSEMARNGAEYLGSIYDRTRLQDIYVMHDVLVVPSQKKPGWEELFGIVLIEGMSEGLCVLASNHVGPRNILDESCGYLLEEKDLAYWVKVIEALDEDRSLLRSKQEAAKEKSQVFSLESVSKKWRDCLQDFL